MPAGWDAAIEASGVAQVERDETLLDEVLDECDLSMGERTAFVEMRETVLRGRALTPKQRAWVQDVQERTGGGTFTRFTDGAVPRGQEVQLLVKDKPLRPPGR